MSRPKSKQPTYYHSRKGYYCWHNGRQILCALGPEGDRDTLEKAFKRYFDLTHEGERGGKSDTLSVYTCLNWYLDWLKKNRKPKTYSVRKTFAQSFVDYLGRNTVKELTVETLTPGVVTDWAQGTGRGVRDPKEGGKPQRWGANSQRIAITTVKAALAHCKAMGHTRTNPLAGMPMPEARARQGYVLISEEQHRKMTEAGWKQDRSGSLRDLLIGLHDTGCRPGELANLTAQEVKRDGDVTFLDLSDWKTEGKHAFRHIFVTQGLQEIIARLVTKHPTGVLFRNARGRRWTDRAMSQRFDALRLKCGLPDGLIPYSYRHTFATDWLKEGKSIKVLAQLLGNSVATIEKHYAHLLDDKAAMQAALRGFRG